MAAPSRVIEDLVKSSLVTMPGVAYIIKYHVDEYAVPGTPDFLMSCNGLACALEIKSQNDRPSADQKSTTSNMQKGGWPCFLLKELDEEYYLLNQEQIATYSLRSKGQWLKLDIQQRWGPSGKYNVINLLPLWELMLQSYLTYRRALQ